MHRWETQTYNFIILKKVQNIWMEVLGKKHPNMANLYINMGNCYKSKKDYDKSLIYYKKALAIWSEILERDAPKHDISL